MGNSLTRTDPSTQQMALGFQLTGPQAIFWDVITCSVRGANHILHDLPNQDSVKWYSERPNCPMVLAVADGHGSPMCFRSGIGSKLATAVSVSAGRKLLDRYHEDPSIENIEKYVINYFGSDLCAAWRVQVVNHINRYPFNQQEIKHCRKEEIDSIKQQVNDNPFLAYGSTLLLLITGPDFFITARLGDGNILAVDEMGNTADLLPLGDDHVGSETNSLCQPNADTIVQVAVKQLSNKCGINMFMLSTDGYINSYATKHDFIRVGLDINTLLITKGPQYINRHMEPWLTSNSSEGSGDDITVGIV